MTSALLLLRGGGGGGGEMMQKEREEGNKSERAEEAWDTRDGWRDEWISAL